jgi:dTDP-4-amino-4,6-dideoxygalactose transaminase
MPKQISKIDIPLAVPDLRGREVEYLKQCVEDNWVSSAGPFVTQLEKEIAVLAGRNYGVATVNGTTALQLVLLAAGITEGDYVIVPDWTFAASVNAIIHAKAIPVFCDIRLSDWTIDPAEVEKACLKYKGKIKAILAVDVLGNLIDGKVLQDIANRFDICLIEDAAGAIGAMAQDTPAGKYGHASTFSFNGNKTITAGGGGMIVTDDKDLADHARHLSTQARIGTEYYHDDVGFNYRMTNINAAIAIAQLERLDEILGYKNKIATNYRNFAAARRDLHYMPVADDQGSSNWLCNIVVADRQNMLSLIQCLEDHGIMARSFWCSLSSQAPYTAYPAFSTRISQSLTDRVITLPSSSNLSPEEQSRVIDALSSWHGDDVL